MKTCWELLILSLAVAVGGCCHTDQPSPAADTERSAVETLQIPPGQICSLELEGNPSTGYSWQMRNSDPAIAEVKYQSFQNSGHKPHFVGAPGKFVWQIKGLQKGSTEVTFRYYRNWEKFDPARDKERKFIISVQSSN